MKCTALIFCLVLAGCAAKNPVIAAVPAARKVHHSVLLNWDPSSNFVAGNMEYRVYRGTPNCDLLALIASGLSTNTFTDNNVNRRTSYCYKVALYDRINKNESKLSTQVVAPVP